jgi:hypothetical protein
MVKERRWFQVRGIDVVKAIGVGVQFKYPKEWMYVNQKGRIQIDLIHTGVVVAEPPTESRVIIEMTREDKTRRIRVYDSDLIW